MNLEDPRFHRKRIPWPELESEGYDPRVVMLEAQKKKMYLLGRRAQDRIRNKKHRNGDE